MLRETSNNPPILPMLWRNNSRHFSKRSPQSNFYRSDGICRLWYQLIPAGEHLTLELCQRAIDIGSCPEWVTDEHGNSGPDFFTGMYGKQYEQLAMEEGLAPNQRFCIEHQPPNWYRCGEYGSEWDVKYEWEIIARETLDRNYAVLRWEAFYRQKAKCITEDNLIKQHTLLLRKTKIRFMYIVWETDHTPMDRWGSSHNRVKVGLYSSYDPEHRYKHTGAHQLAYGSSESEKKEEAWAQLVEKARIKLPGITTCVLKSIEAKENEGWRKYKKRWW